MTKTRPKPPPKLRKAGFLPGGEPGLGPTFDYVETGAGYKLPLVGPHTPAWKDVLERCGYPTSVVVLDFETYFDSDYNMRKSEWSTIEYIQAEQFEVLGLSGLEVADNFPDYEQGTHWWNGADDAENHIRYLQQRHGEDLSGCTVVSQNAAFDMGILAYRYQVYPRYLCDLLGLARHWNARCGNSLGDLCKREGLIDKGDTNRFKGWSNRVRWKRGTGRGKGPKRPKMVAPMTDEQQVELGEYANNDVMREWELFTLYLPRLSTPEIELKTIQHTIELFTKPIFDVDEEKAFELQTAMQAELDAALADVDMTITGVRGDKFESVLETALVWAGDDPTRYHKPAKNKKGWKFAIAKDDPERELLEQHEDDLVRRLMAAKSAATSWPTHMKRVQRIVDQAKAAGGRLPVPLRYHGAHTGRWSGGEGINLQNLGSRGHKLVNAIREVLIAPPGYCLPICDASQIEARVLAWIAGQDDLCQKFANGEEIYCGFASKVLGWTVRKHKETGGVPAIEAKMKWARNSVGKVGVLGCGYQMGPAKAMNYAGGSIDAATAERIVEQYRADNPQIVKFWRDLESAFRYVAKYKRPVEMARGLRLSSRSNCDVVITLPSGRELKYHRVRLQSTSRGRESVSVYQEKYKRWDHVYGGSLTENVVQAISRDILLAGVWGVEEDGYRVGLHVHDEIVAVVPAEHGEEALGASIRHLSAVPDWAEGCPLGAEGKISDRYGDH